MNKIDALILSEIVRHYRELSMVNLFKGLPYERCAELSYIIHEFRPVFNKNLEYLDIGSGKSPLPSFLLKNTEWNITCLDKYEWVDAQYGFAARVKSGDIMQFLPDERNRYYVPGIFRKEFFEKTRRSILPRPCAWRFSKED